MLYPGDGNLPVEVKKLAESELFNLSSSLDGDITFGVHVPGKYFSQGKENFSFMARDVHHRGKIAGLLQVVALGKFDSTSSFRPLAPDRVHRPKSIVDARKTVEPTRRQRVHVEACLPLFRVEWSRSGSQSQHFIKHSAGKLELIGKNNTEGLSQTDVAKLATIGIVRSASQRRYRPVITTAWLDENDHWSDQDTGRRFGGYSALFNPESFIQVFALISISKAYAEEVSLLRKLGAVDPTDRAIIPSSEPSLLS